MCAYHCARATDVAETPSANIRLHTNQIQLRNCGRNAVRFVRLMLKVVMQSLAVSSLLCILELSRLTRVEYGSQKHKYNCNIQGVSVYTNVSANYMFRPLLVRTSSGWIP